MSGSENTFSRWQEAVAGGPEHAAAHYLARVEALADDTRYAVYAHVPARDDLAQAFAQAVSEHTGALRGIPVAVKDLFDVPGLPTRASSRFLAQERADTSSGSAVQRLMANHGLVYAGKTHLNEFAYGLSGDNVHFGSVPHPKKPQGGRLSGGSSSGSAFAVGAGLTPLAFGTDTGGSIRVPAAFCGIVGLRLTPEHSLSKDGCFPLSPLFDTAGWFTSTPEDMRQSIEVLLPQLGADCGEDFKITGAYLPELAGPLDAEVAAALERCARSLLDTPADAGLEADLTQALAELHSTFSTIQSHDAYGVHAPWLDKHRSEYDPVVWDRIDRGRRWTPKQLNTAREHRAAVVAQIGSYFDAHTVLLIPATPGPSPLAKENDLRYRQRLLDLGAPGSLGGYPALSLPVPLGDGLTVGLQVLFPSLERAGARQVLERFQAAG
ncbi:MAG: amidase [Opitutales bacterium]